MLNGKNIVLEYIHSIRGSGKESKNIGTAMQSQLKEVGIGVKIVQVENSKDLTKKGAFDLHKDRWTSAPTADPQYFLEASFKTGGLGNEGHYSNPEFDALCEKLGNTVDKTSRDELGREASKMLMKDVSSIFLYYGMGNVVTRKNITGIHRFISEVYYIDDRVKMN